MSNIQLFTSGVNYMAQAALGGPYLPVKYFLVTYDHTIDPTVHSTSALTPLSAADPISTVTIKATDEILYNLSTISTSAAYSVSNNEMLYFTPGQTGTTEIVDNDFDATSFVNLLSGTPISKVISGTSITYSYPEWDITDPVTISASTQRITYTNIRDVLYNTVSYAPISSAAGGQSRGLFKFRLNNGVGNFKFNKVYFYISKFLSNGTEDTSLAPVLLGCAYLDTPVIKTNNGSNLSFFESDVEFQFSSNGTFSQTAFIANSEWNYVAGQQSLWFDGKVAITTSAVTNQWNPSAKLHISETNPAEPFIRLSTGLDGDEPYIDTILGRSSSVNLDKYDVFASKRMSYTLATSADDIMDSTFNVNLINFYSNYDLSGAGIAFQTRDRLGRIDHSVEGDKTSLLFGSNSNYGFEILSDAFAGKQNIIFADASLAPHTQFDYNTNYFMNIFGGLFLDKTGIDDAYPAIAIGTAGGDMNSVALSAQGLIISDTSQFLETIVYNHFSVPQEEGNAVDFTQTAAFFTVPVTLPGMFIYSDSLNIWRPISFDDTVTINGTLATSALNTTQLAVGTELQALIVNDTSIYVGEPTTFASTAVFNDKVEFKYPLSIDAIPGYYCLSAAGDVKINGVFNVGLGETISTAKIRYDGTNTYINSKLYLGSELRARDGWFTNGLAVQSQSIFGIDGGFGGIEMDGEGYLDLKQDIGLIIRGDGTNAGTNSFLISGAVSINSNSTATLTLNSSKINSSSLVFPVIDNTSVSNTYPYIVKTVPGIGSVSILLKEGGGIAGGIVRVRAWVVNGSNP